QVIVNLFSNAVKFTEPGGQILFSAKKDEKGFSFSVKDTGRGIPEEKIPKLFNKFYQVEEHMTREIQGTGLGLAIVKQIVNMHQGTIKVFSEVGKGTRFTIRIPKAAY
ncbi:MAG: sensor histidine kinase, partial [Candidatus Woesearchaeota archaeon]